MRKPAAAALFDLFFNIPTSEQANPVNEIRRIRVASARDIAAEKGCPLYQTTLAEDSQTKRQRIVANIDNLPQG
jgi:hypothetical protein